jgi:AcrR family transcriptional regulator
MVRWQPGTRDRLRAAALDLYLDQGYEATSVQQIAERAGVTERTFFRHFPDKREVLFDAEGHLGRAFIEAIATAPDGPPMHLAAAGLAASATLFPAERRPWSRARQNVLDANTPLQERELLKLSNLVAAITAALRDRHVPEPTASIAAQSVMSIFQVAFMQWIADGESREMADIQRTLLGEWRAVAAG